MDDWNKVGRTANRDSKKGNKPGKKRGKGDKRRGSDRRANNPLKYGLLSERNLLPWEDYNDFKALHKSLLKDHKPKGVVERHLVLDLASVIWRKFRIGPAESAQFYLAMLKPAKSLVTASENAVEGMNILRGLEQGRKLDDIAEAFANLPDPNHPTTHSDVSRNIDAAKLALIARYETHLDRKFQRTLAMLMTLQRVRRNGPDRSGDPETKLVS